ncbi:hypothetical protein LCGC14_1849650 [marine sediment metagenome]|uniref:Lipoprotein n=1 Tax=marine sediment metagenome TaxID=412755 RepID=A0A0F9GAN5_9ZZZZ
MLRIVTVAALALTLGGCAGLQDLVDGYGGEKALALLEKAAEGVEKVESATLGNAGKALKGYCDKVPPKARKMLRDRLNAREEASGAKIGVWCPNDGPLTLGP